MLGNRMSHNLIWFLIFSIGIESNCDEDRQSHLSLVNASLITAKPEVEEQNLNVEHGKDDMVSMVATLGGNYGGGSVIVGGNKFREDFQTNAHGTVLKFEWHLKLDQLNRYRLDWTVDYVGNEIIFGLNINQTSSKFHQGSDIFALGFSENGELSSSDYCIIWYDLSHKLHLQDARTDSKNRLQLIDAAQSYCKLLKSSHLEHQQNSRNIREARGGSLDSSMADNEYDDGFSMSDSANRMNDRETPFGSQEETLQQEKSIQIVFKRPLEVCGSSTTSLPYYKIDNGTTHLVWFTIKGPLLSMDDLDLTQLEKKSQVINHKHGKNNGHNGNGQFEWAMKRVQLISSDSNTKSKMMQTKSLSLDIRMDKYEIPAKETTYWCRLFKLPHRFETRRYHLTEYEAVIEEGNEHIVHHMELFNCANLNTKQEQDLHDLYNNGGGWSGDCSGQDRPQATLPCRKVILAWAMGARPLVYPELVGQSMGGHGYSPYVVLEVHYNNVELNSGLIDNSGLRFQYTSKLRPYDAGILEVGLEYTDKVSIPPGLVTPIAGHCVGECTRLAMSSSGSSLQIPAGKSAGTRHSTNEFEVETLEDGIYIFAGQMHTHLAGVASWTEIVREGKLVAELQRDNHYSPHFQEIRLLPNHVHVAPGDSLIHYCLYDTRNRSNITLGGYATSDEMCVTYLHYYPRIDLEVCKSSVDTRALEAYFVYLAREERQNTSEKLAELWGNSGGAVKTVGENYHSIQWNARRSKELIQFYAHAPLSIQCNRSNGDRWPGYWNGAMPTRLWSDLASEVGPFESRLPRGDQLMAYRGRGFNHRHAQCQVN